jgi:hypothetical protein
MNNIANITKTTKIDIPYDATTLVDFNIAMSPSSLVITIVNREEKTEVAAPKLKPEFAKPKHIEAKRVETKHVDTKPVDTKHVDTKPVDPKPVEAKHVEAKRVDPKPVDPKPVDPKPFDPKPVDPKPVESENTKQHKVTIRNAIVTVLKSADDWLDYSALAIAASKIFGSPLTKEQVRDVSKKLKADGFLESKYRDSSKKVTVKWVNKQQS